MLVRLSAQRLALIESIDLTFEDGFCALTGETGAGKSILLDAIGLLLGNRATYELIRTGYDDAVVEALFHVRHPLRDRLKTMMSEWGVPWDEDGLLVSRTITKSGRTVCRLNGRLATVQMLRDLGASLVQQHGQHDGLGLLQADEQLRLLDLYAKHPQLIASMTAAYEAWSEAQLAWQSAQLDEQSRIRRLDMLAFQIEEIEKADLRVDEEEELRVLRQRLMHADKIASALEAATSALDGTAKQDGAIALLVQAAQQVAAGLSFDSRLHEANTLLETAQVHADEALRALSKIAGQIEHDPDSLEQLEQRLALIRTLQRKYGPTNEAVLQHLEKAKAEYADLERHEERVAELERKTEQCRRDMERAALRLHESRANAASRFGQEVSPILQKLHMPNAALKISVESRVDAEGKLQFGPRGADQVVFQFSANKGESLKPLSRVASGGELSRTLLAIKVVLAEVDDVDTLIFDEIDTGVSGAAALAIAEQLQSLAGKHQVFCVTHSPQLAAAAHQQFLIAKEERTNDTVSQARLLSRAERVVEIARLLGSDVSDTTAETHALALLDRFERTASKG